MQLRYRQRLAAANDSIHSKFLELRDELTGVSLLRLIFSQNSDQKIISTLKSYITIFKEYEAQAKLAPSVKRDIDHIIFNLENIIHNIPGRFVATKVVRSISYSIDYIREDIIKLYF